MTLIAQGLRKRLRRANYANPVGICQREAKRRGMPGQAPRLAPIGTSGNQAVVLTSPPDAESLFSSLTSFPATSCTAPLVAAIWP